VTALQPGLQRHSILQKTGPLHPFWGSITMNARHGLLLLAATTLAACAHKPIDVTGCDLPLSPLATPPPPPGLEAVAAPPSAYEAAIAAALAPPTTESPQPDRSPAARPVSLFLSGGSQNGAFGAGFIDQWRIGGGGSLPAFRVVTGISTGALQAPYALIGTRSAIDTITALYARAAKSFAPTLD